jgi:hypothetical protein
MALLNITMVPLSVCSRIKYHFVRNVVIDHHVCGNAPTFNNHTDEDVMKIMDEKSFDDIVTSLMKYSYLLPLSGLYFIIHQQSPLLIVKYVDPICRITLQFYSDAVNEHQIFILKCIVITTFQPAKDNPINFLINDLNSSGTFRGGNQVTLSINCQLSMYLFSKHLTKSKSQSLISSLDRRTKVIVEQEKLWFGFFTCALNFLHCLAAQPIKD